jgi:tetratricopeptide (TPR) repeat protein
MKLITKILLLILFLSCSNRNNDKYYNLACQAENNDNLKLAIQYLDKAIKINPTDLYSLNNRGWDKYYIGDTIGALKDFELMIKIDSTCDKGYYNRGDLFIHQQRYKEALSDFNKAVTLKGDGHIFIERTNNDFIGQPEKPESSIGDLFYWKGVANYYTENFQEAFSDFSFCIENGYYVPDSYYMRAFIYYKAGETDKGCKDLGQSIIHGFDYAKEEYNKYCK